MSVFSLYGWEVSPYTAKVRAYLQYKKIPFKVVVPHILTLKRIIEPKVGKVIMPVIIGPEGEILQDSTVIIDALEEKFSSNCIKPHTAKQRFVSQVMELCGDEWLPMAALHFRWNYPGNQDFILSEFGKSALPYFPSILQRKVASTFAGKMKSYLPAMGVTGKMENALETNTHKILNLLNRHFEHHPYLLGTKPCVGDFSMFGPIYAHLHRDPSPVNLVSNYPNTLGWLNRLNQCTTIQEGEFLNNDHVPDTLLDLISLIIEQQFPLINDSIKAISNWTAENKYKTTLPRKIGTTALQIEDHRSERLNLTYPYWMFQKISDDYLSLSEKERNNVKRMVSESSKTASSHMGLLDRKLAHRVELKRCRLHLI